MHVETPVIIARYNSIMRIMRCLKCVENVAKYLGSFLINTIASSCGIRDAYNDNSIVFDNGCNRVR